MKNAIRCCISCILPCGALDMIRIVHSNGRVEEISGTIRAADILKAHPNHVLKKRSSSRSDNGSEAMAPRIVVVPPDAELQRGKIYFLMPAAPLLQPSSPSDKRRSDSSTRKKRRERQASRNSSDNNKNNTKSATEPLVADQYLSDILKEKIWTQSERRRGRVGVWRPHLESILETLIEPTSDQSH